MKTVLLLALTLLLASCGNSGNSGNKQNENQYNDCNGAISFLCLPPAAPWYVTSSSVNFPKHFSLRMISKELRYEASNCPMNDIFTLSKESDGKTKINFRFHVIPKETFKVEIIDLGENCDNNAIFHSEDNVVFGVAEISINGHTRSREVYVSLSN